MLLVQPVHLFRVVSIFPYFYSLTDWLIGAYPIFSILFGKTLQDISLSPDDPNYHAQMRHNGDKDALWFFVIAIGSAIATFIQAVMMHSAGEKLTYILRHKSFKKLLRSDLEYFDQEENSTELTTLKRSKV